MLTKFANTILSSIFLKRIRDFFISEFGINTPPDGVCMLTPLIDDMLGLLPSPWIGSRIDSKSAYIMNGTLN